MAKFILALFIIVLILAVLLGGPDAGESIVAVAVAGPLGLLAVLASNPWLLIAVAGIAITATVVVVRD